MNINTTGCAKFKEYIISLEIKNNKFLFSKLNDDKSILGRVPIVTEFNKRQSYVSFTKKKGNSKIQS